MRDQQAMSRRRRRARRIVPPTLAAALAVTAVAVSTGSSTALNTATLSGSQTWTVQDAAFPGLDTGSVRNTTGGALQGYGGLRMKVEGGTDRLNGVLMRGFGITFDGRSTFDSTQGVNVDGVVVQRNLALDPTKPYGRFLDTFTNMTKESVSVDVAFGGMLGNGTANNRIAVVSTSSGDATITPADGWTSFDTPGGTTRRPSVTVTGTPGTAGALTRAGNFLRDPFTNNLATTGDEANNPAFMHTLAIQPGATVSLAQYVVTGGTDVSALATTGAGLLTTPDVTGMSASQICSVANFSRAALGTTDAACAATPPALITNEVLGATQAELPETTSPFDPIGKNITTLLADYRAGRTNTQQVVRAYLDRIAAYDRGSFGLKSVLDVAPDAMKQAKAADAARKAGDTRPLLGVPILIKDIIDTKDMPTTGGSDLFDGWIPSDDSFQVKKLREAGALILGKTNLSRYANSGHFSESHYGQVWNAFDPSKSSIGSSGGSAVAVASSFGAAAMGTQTGDSLWGPSWGGSLYSLRGTDGMQSSAGTMPLTLITDYVGFIAQSLPDLALLLNATATVDNPDDVLDDVSNGHRPADWTTFLKTDALRGKVIGIPTTRAEDGTLVSSAYTDPFGTTGTESALRAQFAVFEQAGATIKEIPPAPAAPPTQAIGNGSLGNEGWRQWFAAHPDAPVTIDQVSSGTGSTVAQQRGYEAWRAEYRARLATWMADNGVDSVLYPLGLSDIHLNDTTGNSFGRLDPQSSAAGVPTVIFPAGTNANGTPIGFQMQGEAWQDGELMGMAYAYDQLAHGRQIPSITPALTYDADAIPSPVEPLTPIPVNPPAPAPVRTLTVLSTRASATKGGKVSVEIGCASAATACTGTAQVVAAGKRTGAKAVTVASGRKKVVTFTLPKAVRKKLAQGKAVKVRLVLTGTGGTTASAPAVIKVRR